MFLAFQYPLEIPGVATMTFLKAALNAQRKAAARTELTTPEFIRRVNAAAERSKIRDMLQARPQRRLLRRREEAHGDPADGAAGADASASSTRPIPGLDIDALRIVADGVNALRSPDRSFLVITHYQRLLNYIVPDTVHVMSPGRIVQSGGPELAHELEANGYADYRESEARLTWPR